MWLVKCVKLALCAKFLWSSPLAGSSGRIFTIQRFVVSANLYLMPDFYIDKLVGQFDRSTGSLEGSCCKNPSRKRNKFFMSLMESQLLWIIVIIIYNNDRSLKTNLKQNLHFPDWARCQILLIKLKFIDNTRESLLWGIQFWKIIQGNACYEADSLFFWQSRYWIRQLVDKALK